MNYQVGDFIIRLKNASLARRHALFVPYANLTKAIAEILVKEGFLASVKEDVQEGKRVLAVHIAYLKRTPLVKDVMLFSKPSLRVYQKAKHVQGTKRKGLGTEILSTNQGLMTAEEAKKKGLGGERLFRIW